MSDKELWKGTAIYTFSNILLKAGAILFLPILTRLLSPTEYGIVGLLNPIIRMITIIFVFGLYIPQSREYSFLKNNKDKLGSYLFSVNIFLIIIGVLFYIISTSNLGFRAWEFLLDINKVGKINFKLAIIIAIVSSLNLMANKFFQIEKAYRKVSISSIISFIINILISLYLIKYYNLGVQGRIIGFMSGVLFVFCFQYFNYSRKFKLKFNYKYLKESLLIGFPMILTGIMGNIINYSDRIVLGKYLSLEIVGVYSLAYTGGMVLVVFINSYINSWTPNFYEIIQKDKNNKKLSSNLELFIGLLVVISLIGQLFGKELIYFILPNSYLDTVKYLPYIISAMLLQGFYHFLVLFLHYYKDSKYTTFSTILIGVLNLGINITFVPKYGSMVVVWSTILSFFVNVLIYFLIIRFKYKIKFSYLKLAMLYFFTLNPLIILLFKLEISLLHLLYKCIYFILILIVLNYEFSIFNKIFNILRRKKC
ncbi:lipopolysaccharide biosynthesis protein [Orenia marismortui]|uniref:lipopolysaccharide biosynthesis protein n=1 Tax=Orenia marismortui TaxID=46469 RepID=UPI0003794B3E|nr:oligosaccharide flippase family protein [Orenia marismortui]